MDKLKKTFRGAFYCFTGFNSDNWVYKIVALVGLILRIWLLPILIPDLFEVIANFFISNLHLSQLAYEIVIRIILFIVDALALSNIFYWLSYVSVGNLYDSGSAPAWGSACYTMYYFGYNAIPIVLIQNFNWLWIISTICIYAILTTVFYLISAKMDALPDSWPLRLTIHIICFVVFVVVVCLIKGLAF